MTVSQARATESLRQAEAVARARPKDERLEPLSVRASTHPDQFQVIRENLGRLELSNGLAIEDALMNEVPYIDRQQVLVLLTGEMTDETVAGLVRVRRLGYRMMVFVVRNPLAHDKAFHGLVPHGVQVFDMHEEWRLEEIATGRQFY